MSLLHTAAAVCGLLCATLSVSGAEVPRRIISTGPGITEILFALGLGDRVVGVTEYCKYPPATAHLPKVGSWMTFNMEVMLSLKPDLIVVQRTAIQDSKKFQALRLRTLDVSLDSMADIFTAIRSIGEAAGVADRSAVLDNQIRSGLGSIRQRLASVPRTPVLFVVGRNAGSLDGTIAAGPRSYLDELITVAGGRNVLADAAVPYVKVVQEELLARNPQVIIDMGEHAEAAGLSEAQRRTEIGLWRRYPGIAAVKNGRVFIVANQYFVVPGPRIVECAVQIAKLLHPELFH